MAKKFQFYQRYGVQEYYVYDPDSIEFIGWQRVDHYLEPIEDIEQWTSPLLNIQFILQADTLEIYRPDGSPFLSLAESQKKLNEAEAQNARLAARLKELGIDPSEV
jgi:hypothetical protein